jgi:hypothetical protein
MGHHFPREKRSSKSILRTGRSTSRTKQWRRTFVVVRRCTLVAGHIDLTTGGKVLKNNTLKTKNRAGQAFRMAANSVKQAECVFGVFYRRLRARLGPSQATVATAHAIARVIYRMLKYQVEYEPLNVNEYQRQYEAQQIKYLKKRAARFCLQLVPT